MSDTSNDHQMNDEQCHVCGKPATWRCKNEPGAPWYECEDHKPGHQYVTDCKCGGVTSCECPTYAELLSDNIRLIKAHKFIEHIQSHIGIDQVVICKICGKAWDEVDDE